MSKPTKAAVRQWMLVLVMSRQAAMSEADVKVALAASVGSLQIRFPAAAFCQSSADHVVAKERFWSEAGTIKALDEWWRENDPERASLMPQEALDALVSNQARSWLASWYRAKSDAECLRWLRLMHAKCDEAFNWLVQNEANAASMAVMNNLRPTATRHEMAMEWDDEAGIIRHARAAALSPMRAQLMKMLATVVRLHAPQHGAAMFAVWDAMADGAASQAQRPAPRAYLPAPGVTIDQKPSAGLFE